MINIERDSHGRTYQIWKQDQANSCGVASVWMARGIARRMSFAEEEWDIAQRVYRAAVGNALAPLGVAAAGPMTLDPRAFPQGQQTMARAIASTGFRASQLAAAMRGEGLMVEHVGFTNQATRVQPNKIAIDKPAIALVYWTDGGGGAHFVVVGRCTQHSVSFLDPWDGRVNEQPNNGWYSARYGRRGGIGELLYVRGAR